MARKSRGFRAEERLLRRLDAARAALAHRDIYGTGYGTTQSDILEWALLDELEYLEAVYGPFPEMGGAPHPARRLPKEKP